MKVVTATVTVPFMLEQKVGVLQKCMVFKERGTLVQLREKVIHVCEFFSIYIVFSFQRKCFNTDTSKSARYNL